MPLRNVPLPMAEETFLQLPRTALPSESPSPYRRTSSPLQGVPQDSLIAYSVTVNLMFSKIDEINSRAVSFELQGAELIHAVEQVSDELDCWAFSLPERMVNSPKNLAYWTKKGFGNIFVVLHMNYYHLCQLLFYQFLHGSTGQAYHTQLASKQYAQKCRLCATQLCNLIHLASETPGAELLNSIVGHVLTIASTVQLHILLFSDNEADGRNARGVLERNFELLTRLKVFWPCVDISLSRFQAFHQACLRSQDDSQFRMDRWMLKFMLEFATPLAERCDGGGDDVSFERSWSHFSRVL